MNRSVKFVGIAATAMLMLAGCGTTSSNGSSNSAGGGSSSSSSNNTTNNAASATSSGQKYTIGFIPGITTDAFYISMMKGAKAEAAKLGVNLDIQGAAQWNYTLQTPIVNGMVTNKVNMLIIAPNDANAMYAPLNQAVQAGIPVITVDTTINKSSILTSKITSDNSQGGAAAADALAKMIGDKGDVAIINTVPGVSTTDARQNAFEKEIKQKYPNIHIVAAEYSNDQQNTAASQVQNILLSHPNLKGVFATNVVNAAGVAAGLKAEHAQDKVKLIAYDAEPEEVTDLKNGTIQALVVQKPYLEGQMAVDYAYDYLTGQKSKIQKSVVLPNVIATQQNVNDPSVSKWFY